MKTVKDYICSLDADELVRTYFEKRCKKIWEYYRDFQFDEDIDEKYKKMSLPEFVETQIKLLREYVEYLKGVEITASEDGKQGIIYAYSCLDDWFSGGVCTELVHMDELVADPEKCDNYGYEFCEFSEILGYLVADNKFTQGNIYEVIADVLWEASWTGYRQEHLQEELDSLREFENANPDDMTSYESPDEMFEDLLGGDYMKELRESKPEETEESQRLLDAAIHARCEYENCSMIKERMILLKALRGE